MSFWTAIGLGGGTYTATGQNPSGAEVSTSFKAGSDAEALEKTKAFIKETDLNSVDLQINRWGGKETVAIATKEGFHSITTDGTKPAGAQSGWSGFGDETHYEDGSINPMYIPDPEK